MTKIEIINETAQFYGSNPEQRALGDDGTCVYLTNDGRSCAVGRCLIAPKLGSNITVHVLAHEDEEGINPLLKPEYRGHSLSFWKDLQHFHDNNVHFNGNGLTERGERYIAGLRAKYDDQESL